MWKDPSSAIFKKKAAISSLKIWYLVNMISWKRLIQIKRFWSLFSVFQDNDGYFLSPARQSWAEDIGDASDVWSVCPLFFSGDLFHIAQTHPLVGVDVPFGVYELWPI